jgi:hypothetical protein
MSQDEGPTRDHLHEAYMDRTIEPVRPTPRSTSARRAASDRRKQAVGQVRISTWLSAASLEALDALVATWMLGGRTQGVEIAIRHLADQLDRGLIRLRHRV